jgi:trigger factor
MKAQVESISAVKTRLFVEVTPEEVAQEEARGFGNLQRSVTVPGFRKGKAPLSVLRRAYGDRVRSESLSRVVEKTYVEALRQEGIVPVSEPDIDLQPAGGEGGIAYTAVVEVRPKVEPRGYTGLSLQKEKVEVSEPEVEAKLEELRREHASFEPAPEGRPAEEGDMVVIDYEGSIDGTPFEGGKGEGRSLVLGSGTFIPGFEEGIKGAAAGERRTIELTFPEDYRARDLAGRQASFEIAVKEIKVRALPDLDDEFARDAAKVDTLTELRNKLEELIRGEKTRRVEGEFRDRVVDALLQANPFEVPESLVSRQQAQSLDGLRRDLARRGLDLETMGLDKRELHENYRRGAERAVRWAFLLNALATAEKVEVTDEDVDARLKAIAEADGRPLGVIRAFFSEDERLEGLRSSLLEQKVLDRVVAASTVAEVSSQELAGGGEGR